VTVKLLANNYRALNKHISDIQLSNKIITTYLPPTIQNEFLRLRNK